MEISQKEQELRASLSEKKKRVKMNIIELVIWVILLVLAMNYLKTHPAEKTSIFSWFEILIEKVEVFFSWIFGNNSDYLENKHSLEKRFKELITTMEEGKCVDQETIDIAKTRYETLKKLTTQWYKENMQAYQWYARSYKGLIELQCWDK